MWQDDKRWRNQVLKLTRNSVASWQEMAPQAAPPGSGEDSAKGLNLHRERKDEERATDRYFWRCWIARGWGAMSQPATVVFRKPSSFFSKLAWSPFSFILLFFSHPPPPPPPKLIFLNKKNFFYCFFFQKTPPSWGWGWGGGGGGGSLSPTGIRPPPPIHKKYYIYSVKKSNNCSVL